MRGTIGLNYKYSFTHVAFIGSSRARTHHHLGLSLSQHLCLTVIFYSLHLFACLLLLILFHVILYLIQSFYCRSLLCHRFLFLCLLFSFFFNFLLLSQHPFLFSLCCFLGRSFFLFCFISSPYLGIILHEFYPTCPRTNIYSLSCRNSWHTQWSWAQAWVTIWEYWWDERPLAWEWANIPNPSSLWDHPRLLYQFQSTSTSCKTVWHRE